MHVINIDKNLKEYDYIHKLYLDSFPIEERMDWSFLMKKSKQENVEFLGYYDEETLVGFSYAFKSEKCVFVLFFAIDSSIRSHGYGSRIIQMIINQNKDKMIALNIELLDHNADNYNDRLRRYGFYKKNGFYDTEYDLYIEDEHYMILSSTSSFDKEAYLSAIGLLDPSKALPSIVKRD